MADQEQLNRVQRSEVHATTADAATLAEGGSKRGPDSLRASNSELGAADRDIAHAKAGPDDESVTGTDASRARGDLKGVEVVSAESDFGGPITVETAKIGDEALVKPSPPIGDTARA